jgi:endo-1,4-beta-xylanase
VIRSGRVRESVTMSYNPPRTSLSSSRIILTCFAVLAIGACAQSTPVEGDTGSGGTNQTGGSTGTGGHATGGTTGTGGVTGTGGAGTGGTGTGGVIGTGGAKGGTTGTGGTGTGGTGTGGTGTGGTGTGGAKGGSSGATGTGGAGTGGLTGTGGVLGTGGAKGGTTGTGGTGTGGGKGGATGTGGTSATGGTSGGTDPCTVTTLPSGGTQHTSSNASGTAGSLSWTIWSNGSAGSITTFSTPAFVANWNNSGDYLARIGLQWGNSGKSVSSLGTVGADFSETKSGSAGGYSYIGIYGWSVNPCVEWYIVDDSYGNLPFNPGGSQIGTLSVDGGTYNIIQRNTTGTGGNRCGNVSSWNQIYSMRTTKRSCGHISISDHWAAWASHNQTLGNQLEASILVEAGGGSGSVQFPLANVTAQ